MNLFGTEPVNRTPAAKFEELSWILFRAFIYISIIVSFFFKLYFITAIFGFFFACIKFGLETRRLIQVFLGLKTDD